MPGYSTPLNVTTPAQYGLRRSWWTLRIVSGWAGVFGPGLVVSPRALSSEVISSMLAGGVGAECPGDVRSALGVDGDGTDLAAVLDVALVEVPQRRAARGSSLSCLLSHAPRHLSCEVPGAELRDGRHDPMEQPSARCGADRLGSRDQVRAGLQDRLRDRGVVGAVASQPVDLVDDHEVDRLLLDVAQHPL